MERQQQGGMNLKPAAFIFDMDGVIIDSEPIHSRVKMDTFHHFGLPFEEADLIHYMGRTSNETFGEVIAKEGRHDLQVEDLVRYKHEHYLEVLQSGTIEPIEGAVELIRHLYDEGIPLALATSSWERVMDTVLDAFKIRPYFQSVLSGSTLPKSKPDPAIYKLLCDTYHLDPAQCVFIDDSQKNVDAARAFGIPSVHFTDYESACRELEKLLND